MKVKTDKAEPVFRYLGDGVYACFDGVQFSITIGSHDNLDHRIVLESEVRSELNSFARECVQIWLDINSDNE